MTPGDHASELYRSWAPRVALLRRDVALSTGLHVVPVAVAGGGVLTAPRRPSQP